MGISTIIGVMVAKSIKDDPLSDPDVMSALLFSTGIAGAGATFWAARTWARGLYFDRSGSGLGLVLPRTRTLLFWGAVGVGLAGLYLFMALVIHHAGFSQEGGGTLAQAAGRGGLSRLVWTLLALFIAPPSEELLFRGLLLRGMAASWGPLWAGLVVTALFVAMHLSETVYYWPSTIFIFLMAVLALVARLRSGSLVSSMALHAGYNAVIVAVVYLWTE